jgi:GH25 family lysozyme M1 (1,4-beta-N-acetylmuramidase)
MKGYEMKQIEERDEAVMGERLAVSSKLSAFSLWRRLCARLAGSSTSFLTTAIILMEVIFPDVSFWQGIIDFVKMKLAGAMGVIIRAGQNQWVDSFWFINWVKAKEAGLPRGSYWFYDSRYPPKQQARIWASLVLDDSGEMEHCADFEENYGGAYKGWRNWYDFLVEFQRLTGLPDDRIAIYTGYYYWIQYGPNPVTEAASLAWFGRFALWEAWYTNNPDNVKIPKPWTSLRHWQKGTPAEGVKYGVQTLEIDINHSNMTQQQFILKYTGETLPDDEEPIPDGGGDVMKEGTVIYANGLNFRNGPGTQYKDIGDLWVGDKVYGELDTATNWIHFNKIVRVSGAVENVDGWASAFSQYMQLVDYAPPVGDEYILHVKDGVERKFVPE